MGEERRDAMLRIGLCYKTFVSAFFYTFHGHLFLSDEHSNRYPKPRTKLFCIVHLFSISAIVILHLLKAETNYYITFNSTQFQKQIN